MYTTRRQQNQRREKSPPPQYGAYRRAPDTTAFVRGGKKKDKGKKPANPIQQLVTMCFSFLGVALWYTTPISNYVVDVMLMQVPYEADRELGLQAIKEFPHPTIYHPKWTPLVQQVRCFF